MKHTLTILYILFTCIPFSSCKKQIAAESEQKLILHSAILNEDRVCLVSLPDSYDDTSEEGRDYPVLILLDGAVHFKTAIGVTHFMSSPRAGNHLMPETIIVAIESPDREKDLTVTKIKTARPNTMGGGKDFLKFIQDELIPYIDTNYRTTSHRTLAGHSLGGLLTINAYMDKGSLFDSYLAVDPSLWWDEQLTGTKVDTISPASFQKKLYIATANQGEAKEGRNKKRHDLFFSLLQEKSAGEARVKLEYFEEENHRSVPLPALYYGLKYLNE
ncbi:alpha/beta hydrolase [Robertkochia flava]|uniref:alpha/beta hydrolase n=1 Tax=Robertkochia flava TaxID=3447986 RepID=UPI001CCDB557|nr:alpha/beta hydrolase-fold protein [Robertkochia marina]